MKKDNDCIFDNTKFIIAFVVFFFISIFILWVYLVFFFKK